MQRQNILKNQTQWLSLIIFLKLVILLIINGLDKLQIFKYLVHCLCTKLLYKYGSGLWRSMVQVSYIFQLPITHLPKRKYYGKTRIEFSVSNQIIGKKLSGFETFFEKFILVAFFLSLSMECNTGKKFSINNDTTFVFRSPEDNSV